MLGTVAAQVNPAVDVVIVGSGPVGSAFARAVHERGPSLRILMLEAGPQLTPRPGVHLKNIADADARARAQLLSEGPGAEAAAAAAAADGAPEAGRARPGTAFIDHDNAAFPDGAMSTNVGGMGAHWTCACPRAGDGERITLIPERELDEALAAAERFLSVRRDAFPDSPEGRAILHTLRATYNPHLPDDRKVDRMPLACAANDGRPYWTGTDVVLGPLAEPDVDVFELRAETICRRLVVEGNRVRYAEAEHLPTGRQEQIAAKTFFVACDAIRTPQLLWASDIRPPALGRYLNDHTQVICGVRLDRQLVDRADDGGVVRGDDDPIVGVFWVPYSAGQHPYHGQVMHLEMSPIEIVPDAAATEHVVGLGWFIAKDIRAEDRVTFSDREADAYGMPRPRIEYELTPRDSERIEAAIADQARGAAALGEEVPGRGPTIVPPGSSLHYHGTTRMGEADDGTSVCDSSSRVWGFDNLFVGGNGVIPTPTASNPTLTSVALAIRAARAIA
jgi:choline dehydrogenase-like flavoprotein